MSTVDKYRTYANHLVRNPDDAEALINQFAVLSDRRDYGEHYYWLSKRAYELEPDEVQAAFCYGSACHRTGRFDEALRVYLLCLKMADKGWMPTITHHVGIAYRALGADKRAIEWYTKAHKLNPDPQILKDRALAYLADGQLNKGLQEFEIRRETAMIRFAQNRGDLVAQQKLPDGVVHWQGEDLTGKTVVVYHEEGTGDFFQFCRFIPRLRDKGVAKILLTGAVLNVLELVSDNIEVDGFVPLGGPFECDYVIGSMTLPWRCGAELDQVNGKPYFKAEPKKLPKRGKLNVGLVWRGNSAYGQDVHRSMSFLEYAPLFDIPGVAFHSLQAGPAGLEVTNYGFDGFVANLEPFCSTWRDTASVIQSLDVLVTVDTACAHLAGALGKPAFVLVTNSSDWRWDRNSEHSVWYDSLRIIRQDKQDEWGPCIARVKDALREMVSERRLVA